MLNLFYDIDPPRLDGIDKFNSGNHLTTNVYEDATQIFSLAFLQSGIRLYMNITNIPIDITNITLDTFLYDTEGVEIYHSIYNINNNDTRDIDIIQNGTIVSGTSSGLLIHYDGLIKPNSGYFYRIGYDSVLQKLHHLLYEYYLV